MRPQLRILESPDAGELLDEDVGWWLEAGAPARLAAVDEARRDLELLGRTPMVEERPRATNRDFEDFLRLLEEHRVEYLIVGGYAVAFHATPRFTKDLDVLVRPEVANARRLIAALTAFIGDPGISPERFERHETILFIGIPPTRIDVLGSIPGCDFEQAWTRRVEGTYGGQKAWFMGLEDLIAAKRASGREQDLRDVERLQRVLDLGGRVS